MNSTIIWTHNDQYTRLSPLMDSNTLRYTFLVPLFSASQRPVTLSPTSSAPWVLGKSQRPSRSPVDNLDRTSPVIKPSSSTDCIRSPSVLYIPFWLDNSEAFFNNSLVVVRTLFHRPSSLSSSVLVNSSAQLTSISSSIGPRRKCPLLCRCSLARTNLVPYPICLCMWLYKRYVIGL